MTEYSTTNPTKEKGLSGSTLKLVAIITMLLDHIGASLIMPYIPAHPELNTLYYILRFCGRVAFPIFCFLLVEGFLHTRNVAKYCLRLALFALISEIPFDLAFHQKLFYPEAQNVFFTLLIGLLTIWGLKSVKSSLSKRPLFQIIAEILIMLAGMFAAWGLKTDYDCIGVLIIIVLYENHQKRTLATATSCFFLCLSTWLEITAFFAVPLVKCYNGKRGLSLKYVFYLFYPVHLLLLYLIGKLL